MCVTNCGFSQGGKKQYWIWLSSWTRVFKSSSLVVDKVTTFLTFLLLLF
jgi:hypothetical protein